jgi:hypothetical protein
MGIYCPSSNLINFLDYLCIIIFFSIKNYQNVIKFIKYYSFDQKYKNSLPKLINILYEDNLKFSHENDK